MTFKSSQKQLIPVDIINTIDITDDYIKKNEANRITHILKLEINGKCPFDDFINVSPKKVSKKARIHEELDAYLTLLIQGEEVPPNKLHSIGSNEYEIRIKRTRLYFFFDPPNNNIVVLGHYNKKKDNQQEFIDKFRALKLKYLSQKK